MRWKTEKIKKGGRNAASVGESSDLRLCGFIDIVHYGDFCNNRLKLINSDGDGKEWEYRLFRFGEKNDHGAGCADVAGGDGGSRH